MLLTQAGGAEVALVVAALSLPPALLATAADDVDVILSLETFGGVEVCLAEVSVLAALLTLKITSLLQAYYRHV